MMTMVNMMSIFAKSLACCVLALTMGQTTFADPILSDDFSDGGHGNGVPLDRNGLPVTWSPSDAGIQLSAESGDLLVSSSSINAPIAYVDDLLMSGNVSIRSQVRLNTEGAVGFAARGHWALLNSNTHAGIGRLGSSDPLENPLTQFNPMTEDFLMQLDVIGNEYSLWVWRPGDPMPADPLVQLTDNSPGNGDNRIGVGGASASFPDASQYEAMFRFVQVSDTHIPEPSAWAIASILTVTIGVWQWRRKR